MRGSGYFLCMRRYALLLHVGMTVQVGTIGKLGVRESIRGWVGGKYKRRAVAGWIDKFFFFFVFCGDFTGSRANLLISVRVTRRIEEGRDSWRKMATGG